MNHEEVAKEIFELSGSAANVSSITHCTTRLRLFIRDKSKVDTEAIKKIKGVLGVVYNGDELQVVLGKNLIPTFSAASKLYEEAKPAGGEKNAQPAAASPAPEAPKTWKERLAHAGEVVVGFVSAAVTPLIPGLVAGGMIKVFLLLITLAWPAFEEAQTYTLLSMLADVPFYFMPTFVAYGAAKKLGATPLYAMSVATALIYPGFVAMVDAGESLSVMGLPVYLASYSSTLLPALLISLAAYFIEKFLAKVIPGLVRPIFVGLGTMVITYLLGVTFLAPLGDMIGSQIVHVFLWASSTFGPIAIGLLAACMPWLVMMGMHHAVTPFMVQAFANPGYDVFFRPSYILHNMSEGGACLGVALRCKNAKNRAECLSLAFSCIVAGVTEPSIYGVNFPLKKPMYGVMAGGAAGGVAAGLLGACAYEYGYSTILALPIFHETLFAMLAAIIVAIVVSAAVTAVLGIDEDVLQLE